MINQQEEQNQDRAFSRTPGQLPGYAGEASPTGPVSAVKSKLLYVAPKIEVVEVSIERGFAASDGGYW